MLPELVSPAKAKNISGVEVNESRKLVAGLINAEDGACGIMDIKVRKGIRGIVGMTTEDNARRMVVGNGST